MPRRRISSQVPDDARLAVADVVIETAGTLEETLRQTDELWERLPRASQAGRRADEAFRPARTRARCRRPRLPWIGADHPLRTPLRGHQRIPALAATSRRRSPSSPRASTRVRRMSCCSARPAPASRRPRRGSSSRCSGRRSCSRTTRPSRRSWPTSSASSCRTTRSSTSSATTTTTSPRPTSRRPTPSSRRTRRSTPRSSGCGTRRRTRCSAGAT